MKYSKFFAATALAFLFCPALACAQAVSGFTVRDAEAVIAGALHQSGASENIRVSVDGANEDTVIESVAGTVTAEAQGLTVDKAQRRWQAMLMPKADGRNLAPVRLSGTYEEMVSVPVLKRRVPANEIIGQEDIEWSTVPANHVRRNMVTQPQDLIGKSAKHMISQSRPIRLNEIAGQTVVNKGAQVTLSYHSHNIDIKTFGEALNAGAVGDVIHVRNSASKTVVQGRVESSGHVRVSSPDENSTGALW